MSPETWSSSPKPPQRSLEILKETFKQRLEGILNKQLTVENIQTFADRALTETVRLTEDMLTEYRSNPNVHPNQIPIDKKIQEDEACAIFGLPDVNEILQSIIDVKEKIYALGRYINEINIVADKVIIPPQSDLQTEIKVGSGQGIEDKKLIPRLLTLLYILETDFDIKKEQIKITEGKVAPDMMRKTPYVRVEIPDMGRVVYICDEESNVSYIFDTSKLEKSGINPENLDISDKGAMNDLIEKYPGVGARIIQTKHWRTNISEILANPIPEKAQENGTTEKPEKPVSEFRKREKIELLSFEKFQADVRKFYTKEKNINEWYQKERKKLTKDGAKLHPNWPANPDQIYKVNWNGLKNLVERYLPFYELKIEATKIYPGKGHVFAWYVKEQRRVDENGKKLHPNWPAHPNEVYEKDWNGWSEFVGIENEKKREFLPFEEFKNDVIKFYTHEKDINKWYQKERKKVDENGKKLHPNWHSNPYRFYKNKGWIGWLELVGKKKE